jgi:hypothetical protein
VRSASRKKLHQEARRESEKSLGEADESATGSTFSVRTPFFCPDASRRAALRCRPGRVFPDTRIEETV